MQRNRVILRGVSDKRSVKGTITLAHPIQIKKIQTTIFPFGSESESLNEMVSRTHSTLGALLTLVVRITMVTESFENAVSIASVRYMSGKLRTEITNHIYSTLNSNRCYWYS